MISDDEIDIRKTLMRSYRYISELLNSKNRDKNENFYLLSGLLRSLLCDSDNPYLLTYADKRKISLSIVSKIDYSISNEIAMGLVQYINKFSLLPHWPSFNDGEVVPIQIFLDSPLGVTTDANNKGVTYTAREIIKWCSNKDGITHYYDKKPKVYESLKNTIAINKQNDKVAFIIQNIIYSLSYWTESAILYVLNKEESRQQLENEIKNRNNRKYTLPVSLNLVAHYRMLQQSYLMTFFEGIHCCRVDNINQMINKKLDINALMMIPENYNDSKKNIYTFSIDTGIEVKINIKETILLIEENIRGEMNEYQISLDGKIEYFKYYILSIEISKSFSLEYSIAIDGNTIFDNRNFNEKRNQFTLVGLSIGGNELLRNFGLFFMNELILSKDTELEIDGIINYLWYSILIK